MLFRYLRIQNYSTRSLIRFEGNARSSEILTVSTEAGTAKIVKGMYAIALKKHPKKNMSD